MADIDPQGYDSFSINKYDTFMYGEGWKYGLRYPSPKPENFLLFGLPIGPGGYQITSSRNPRFSWTLPYGDTSEFVYQIQIVYNVNDFTTPLIDVFPFSSSDLTWLLPLMYSLSPDGIYYARIRTTDAFTWSDWSDVLKFGVAFLTPLPPTIDPVTSPASDFWQVITGTHQPCTYVYIRDNGGEWREATYIDGICGTRWSYNMPLVPGTNYIEAVASYSHSTEFTSRAANATIYLGALVPELWNVWNCFDEFGLLLGLPRILGERNREYKARLLDVYQNPANSTYDGLRNGISREIGVLPREITITTLANLMDKDYPGNLLNASGNAIGTPLEGYAEEVYENNPIFLGNVISDESYWDGVDEQTNGYVYLPHMWDPNASGIYDKWQTGGIGDQDDLWVNDPVEIWNPGISGYSWYLPIHSGYFYSAYPSGFLLI